MAGCLPWRRIKIADATDQARHYCGHDCATKACHWTCCLHCCALGLAHADTGKDCGLHIHEGRRNEAGHGKDRCETGDDPPVRPETAPDNDGPESWARSGKDRVKRAQCSPTVESALRRGEGAHAQAPKWCAPVAAQRPFPLEIESAPEPSGSTMSTVPFRSAPRSQNSPSLPLWLQLRRPWLTNSAGLQRSAACWQHCCSRSPHPPLVPDAASGVDSKAR